MPRIQPKFAGFCQGGMALGRVPLMGLADPKSGQIEPIRHAMAVSSMARQSGTIFVRVVISALQAHYYTAQSVQNLCCLMAACRFRCGKLLAYRQNCERFWMLRLRCEAWPRVNFDIRDGEASLTAREAASRH